MTLPRAATCKVPRLRKLTVCFAALTILFAFAAAPCGGAGRAHRDAGQPADALDPSVALP